MYRCAYSNRAIVLECTHHIGVAAFAWKRFDKPRSDLTSIGDPAHTRASRDIKPFGDPPKPRDGKRLAGDALALADLGDGERWSAGGRALEGLPGNVPGNDPVSTGDTGSDKRLFKMPRPADSRGLWPGGTGATGLVSLGELDVERALREERRWVGTRGERAGGLATCRATIVGMLAGEWDAERMFGVRDTECGGAPNLGVLAGEREKERHREEVGEAVGGMAGEALSFCTQTRFSRSNT